MRKRLHPVLKAALWGAGVPAALTLLAHATGEFGLLFVMVQPTDLIEKAMGLPTDWPQASRFEFYVLPYLVNASIGAVVCALPVALFALVDYYRIDQPK